MVAGTQSHTDADSDSGSAGQPHLSVCNSRPGTSVFLESGNTDGWISTDLTVDVHR